MIPQAEALYNLQSIDLQIIQFRTRLKEIMAELEDNQAVAEIQSHIASAEQHLKPLRAKAHDLELEIQSNNTKKQATEDRLYGGSVKNPKELQDMQQEIDTLNTRNNDLEEKLLEQMMLVEEGENTLNTHESALQTLLAELEGQHGDLLTEQKDLAAKIQRLKQERERVIQTISAANLETYNNMRKKKANRPIAVMQGDTCSICGVGQTTMTEQLVRQGQTLILCDNCGRILVEIRS